MPIIVAMPLVMRTSGRTADFVSIKHIPTIAFESSYIGKDYAPSLRSVKILEGECKWFLPNPAGSLLTALPLFDIHRHMYA
ncbi:MAG: hypothetical protein NTAFB01_42070 [Nitrospira sp.]